MRIISFQEELDKAAKQQAFTKKVDVWSEGYNEPLILKGQNYKGQTFWTDRFAAFLTNPPKACDKWGVLETDKDPSIYFGKPLDGVNIEMFAIGLVTDKHEANTNVLFMDETTQHRWIINTKYYAYLIKTFGKDLTYRAGKEGTPLRVYKGSECVAAVMSVGYSWEYTEAIKQKILKMMEVEGKEQAA